MTTEVAGDAGADGAKRAPGLGPGRGGATVQAGPFIVERADAVDTFCAWASGMAR